MAEYIDCMTREDAENMDNEQAKAILITLRNMMRDQYGCPISDAYFALDKAIKALAVKPVVHGHLTNADRIRSMTDEELAELCSTIKRNYSLYPYSRDVWLEWMKEEVDDGSSKTV